MKKSTKIISIILVFFLIIATVIIGRTMIGNHFKKKFSKIPPPGIIVTQVVEKEFAETIETFGTAISKKSETFKIKKDDLFEDLKLKNFVKKGEIIIKLKSGNIIAPFSGVLGYTGLTEDILVSDNIIIITLDDNSTIYSDLKIPEPRIGLRSGNIKNSFCIPYSNCLNPDKTFKNNKELKNVFETYIKNINEKNIVFSCGSGVTACVFALAYSVINDKYHPCIYDGSWAEYGII